MATQKSSQLMTSELKIRIQKVLDDYWIEHPSPVSVEAKDDVFENLSTWLEDMASYNVDDPEEDSHWEDEEDDVDVDDNDDDSGEW